MPSVPSHPYVSSTEAAKDFHLTNDYIGALCRTGKVEGKLVGRLWYVNTEALSTYLAQMREARLAQRKTLSMQWRKAWAVSAALLIAVSLPQTSHASSPVDVVAEHVAELFSALTPAGIAFPEYTVQMSASPAALDDAFVEYLPQELAQNYLAAVHMAAESQALGWQAFGETMVGAAHSAYAQVHAAVHTAPQRVVGEYAHVRPPLPYFGNIIQNGRDLIAALQAPALSAVSYTTQPAAEQVLQAPYLHYLPHELVQTYTTFVYALAESQALGWQTFGETVVDTVAGVYQVVRTPLLPTTQSGTYTVVQAPLPSLDIFVQNGRALVAALHMPTVVPVRVVGEVMPPQQFDLGFIPYLPEAFVETTYAIRDISERVYGGIARTYVEYATAWFEYSSRMYKQAIEHFVAMSIGSGDSMAAAYQAAGETYLAGFNVVSAVQLQAYALLGGASATFADQFQYHTHEFAVRVVAVVAGDVGTLQTASVWDAVLEWYNSLGTSTDTMPTTATPEPIQQPQPVTPVRSASSPVPSVPAAPSVVYIQPPHGDYVTRGELTTELQILSNTLRSLVAEISSSVTSPSSPTPPYVAAGGSGYLTVTASNSTAVTQTTINESLEDYLPLTGGTISDDLVITGTASTTDLIVSGLGSGAGNCLTTDSSGVITTTTCGSGGGAAFPFTPDTNYGALSNSTSTPIWLTAGLQASSTSHFVYASSTAFTASAFCLASDCRTSWSSVGSLFPFTATTNFGVSVNSTSTPIWFTAGIMASSTSYIASTTFAVDGNVGVGTTTPWGKLSVTNAGSDPSFVVEDQASPDSTPFVVTSAGLVGIGTASPSASLEISKGNILIGNGRTLSSYTADGVTSSALIYGSNVDSVNVAESVIWKQAVIKGITAKHNGNVGISTTSPIAYLSVQNSYGTPTSTIFVVASTTNSGGSTAVTLFSVSNTGSTTLGLFGSCSGSRALTTNSAGDISCGAISGGAAFPFTASAVGNATSTLLMLNGGASTTLLSVYNNAYFGATATSSFNSAGALTLAGITDKALTTNSAGLVYGVATGTISAGNGITLSDSTRQIFGGSLTITNSIGYPFPSNATSTSIAFNAGLTATGATLASTTLTGNFVFANATGTNATTTNFAVTGTASTSKLFADGLTSCNSASNALTWNAGAFGCNTITGGSTFPFTATTNFGSTVVNSTSTPIWFTAGIMASSTSYIASTTFAINGNVGVGSSTPWALLSVESKAGLDSFAVGSSTGTYFVVSSAGRVGVGTSTPFAPLSVTNSSSQLALAYDATRYASLAVDATGNLSLTTVNATTSLMNSNVTVCDNSACPTTWTATSTRGNLFVENAVVIGADGFSLREIDSTSLGLYNASGQIMVIFDNGN